MNIFVDSGDYYEVNLYIGEEDGNVSCVSDEKEAKKKFDDEKYETHWVRFSYPTYGTSLQIQELSFTVEDGKAIFDPLSFRANRCFTLLKDWSFVDKNNNKVPATRESMEKMNDIVAQTILLELDKV